MNLPECPDQRDDDSVCRICRRPIRYWESVFNLPCWDFFHVECLANLSNLKECPVCDEPLSEWHRTLLRSHAEADRYCGVCDKFIKPHERPLNCYCWHPEAIVSVKTARNDCRSREDLDEKNGKIEL